MGKYPFEKLSLVKELEAKTTKLRKARVIDLFDTEIERYFGMDRGTVSRILAGRIPPENNFFRDYAEYILEMSKQHEDVAGPISSNAKRYLQWEDCGWVIPRTHYEFAVKVLENEIANLEFVGVTRGDHVEELKEAVSLLRHHAEER